jgi:23S rRNA (guanosine2251-2'-O)-methyltransferase
MTKNSSDRPNSNPRHGPRTGGAPYKERAPKRSFGGGNRGGGSSGGAKVSEGEKLTDGTVWIYGTHAVMAAMANPKRKVLDLRATRNAAEALPEGVRVNLIEGEELSAKLPSGAVHQGIAVRVTPLDVMEIDEAIPDVSGIVLVLDQVTDPQNIGAVFRSAAAFGARAIIQQDRKAPPITGSLAKAAVGGIELVPDVRVVNISQTIKQLADDGWMTVGLSGEADKELSEVLDGSPVVLVMGAEGKGLRHLVGERCDYLARIPIGAQMESLNVSAASAIALYAAYTAQKHKADKKI